MATYANKVPFGLSSPSISLQGYPGTINAQTPTPVGGLPSGNALAGPISRGPSISGVPGLGTPLTGTMSTNYNGGANGNRQMGMFWANESLKSQYVIVNDEEMDPGAAMTKSLGEGMFLFNASSIYGYQHAPLENTVRMYGSKVSVMYDVWALNQILIRRAAEYHGPKMTAETMMLLWNPVGVIKNEAAPTRTRLGDERFGSRMVNLVVGFRVKTFNIWGGDIDVGTRMFFICKKVKLDDSLKSVANSAKRTRLSTPVKYVWRFFPYANKEHDTPPLSVLRYKDEDENGNEVMRIGAYVCVGMSSERAAAVPVSTKDELTRSELILHQFRASQTTSRYPSQIEIYVTN